MKLIKGIRFKDYFTEIGSKVSIKFGKQVGQELIGSNLVEEQLTVTESKDGYTTALFDKPKHPLEIEDYIEELESLKDNTITLI